MARCRMSAQSCNRAVQVLLYAGLCDCAQAGWDSAVIHGKDCVA